MEQRIDAPWLLETAPLHLSALHLGPEGSITAPPGKRALMCVDSVLTDPVPGDYRGDIVLTLAEDMPKLGEWENDYRSALLVTQRGVARDGCALAAVTGLLTDTSLEGGTILAKGNTLNGLTVTGGQFSVSGTRFQLDGNGGDDFQLWGSAVAAYADAFLILDGVDIQTKGVVATGVAVAGTAKVVVKDARIRSQGTDNANWYAKHPHLSETPWVLGIRGTLRATNVLDAANVTYYGCDCACNGWGVLSTDGTKGAVHNIINTRAVIPQGEGFASGYGAYILGGVTSTFLGAEIEVPDFCFAVGGNNEPIVVGSSSQENLNAAADRLAPLAQALGGLEGIPERPSVIRSRRFVGMWHHQSTAPFIALPGTSFQAGDTAFLIKSGAPRANGPEIRCDGCTIDAPRIVHLMETDDAGMGVRTHDKCWAPCVELYPDAVTPAEGYDPTGEGETPARLTLKDMTLSGDCWNTRQTQGQALVITLAATCLTGVISSGSARHRRYSYGVAKNPDGSRTCTDLQGRPYITQKLDDLLFGKMPVTSYVPEEDETGGFVYDEGAQVRSLDGYGIWYKDPAYLADVDIVASPAVNNPVHLTLTDGAVWIVAGESHLTRLTIEPGCALVAPAGRQLLVTLDGQPIVPASGACQGDICITVV